MNGVLFYLLVIGVVPIVLSILLILRNRANSSTGPHWECEHRAHTGYSEYWYAGYVGSGGGFDGGGVACGASGGGFGGDCGGGFGGDCGGGF